LREDNRTIVLTTHHLDEAEALSDRIGIMAKGKLLTLGNINIIILDNYNLSYIYKGTSDFIKKNFGVGYNLTLSSDINYH
jgi:ATP-binding cassette, subfamily A (ABC1), member 3